jgi:hypothetical protein
MRRRHEIPIGIPLRFNGRDHIIFSLGFIEKQKRQVNFILTEEAVGTDPDFFQDFNWKPERMTVGAMKKPMPNRPKIRQAGKGPVSLPPPLPMAPHLKRE